MRQAAGPGEWLGAAVMRGSAALPVVVPTGDRDPERAGALLTEMRLEAGEGGGPGTADPPAALRPLLLLLLASSCSRPGSSCGRYHGGQRR